MDLNHMPRYADKLKTNKLSITWAMLPICKGHNAKIYDFERHPGEMACKPSAIGLLFNKPGWPKK